MTKDSEVTEAATADEAIDHCRRQRAEVLVTDIRMPGRIDGCDLAGRRRVACSDLLAIYATRPVPGSITLLKPFHAREIVRAIGRLDSQREDQSGPMTTRVLSVGDDLCG